MLRLHCIVALAAIAPFATGQAAETNQADTPTVKIELPGSKQLDITAELRWRAEKRQDYDFNNDKGSNPGFIGQRARVGLGFKVNDNVRTKFVFQDVRNFGEEMSTIDPSADGFDLHQAFVEWDVWDEVEGVLKLGRQEIELGDQRLVSSLNWANQGRAFDGALFTFEPTENVDAIAFVTVLGDDVLNNDNQGAWLGGLYVSSECVDGHVNGDVYLLFMLDEETVANGTANRWTLGTRVRGRSGGLDGGIELATQFGEQDNADIPFGETFAFHGDVGFTFEETQWKPKVMAEVNLASGNDPNSTDNERFNSIASFSHAYLGYMDFALWENITQFALWVTAHPGGTTVKLAWHHLRANEAGDRFAGTNAVLSTGIANGDEHMGDEFDLTCHHDLGDGIWGEAGIGVFLPGNGVKMANAGFDDTALFLYYMLGLKL